MKESDYYPAGAYSDPNAPYNQCEPPEIELDVTVSETLTRASSIVTNNAYYVTDEEGYTELNTENFSPVSDYEEQNDLLSIVIFKAKEEITKLREEAEREQLKLEDHFGVRHNTIPGYYLPEIPESERSFHVNRRKLLGEAMNRVNYLKALEAGLDGWEHDDIEVELDN
jgi:hypothetical protein